MTAVDGQALLAAGAKASVPLNRLVPLLDRVESAVDDDHVRRTYECVYESADAAVYLAPSGFWVDVGEDVGFEERESDAVRRAHAEQLRRFGREADRLAEFETALDVRDAVVLTA